MPRITESKKHGGILEREEKVAEFNKRPLLPPKENTLLEQFSEEVATDELQDELDLEPETLVIETTHKNPKRKSIEQLNKGHVFPEEYKEDYRVQVDRDLAYDEALERLNKRFQTFTALKNNDTALLTEVTGRKLKQPSLEDLVDAVTEPEVDSSEKILGARQSIQRDIENEYKMSSARNTRARGPSVGSADTRKKQTADKATYP